MKTNTAKVREALIEDRRARVASYKLQGLSLRKTIDALTKDGYVNPTSKRPWGLEVIKKDVDALIERWRQRAQRDIEEVKARDLAKIDEAEREAWEAWRRSCGKHQVRTTRTKRGKAPEGEPIMPETETTLRTEELAGDPRFLDLILACRRDRAKILGYESPTRFEASGPNGGPISVQAVPFDLTNLSDLELEQLDQLVGKVTPPEEP